MNTGRIDFISEYCDRWCERCAYTSRCSAFAVKAAAAMCGDFFEGLELAVGAPHPVEASGIHAESAGARAAWENVEMTAEETADLTRREEARETRVNDSPIMTCAWAFAMVSHRWFAARSATVSGAADAVLQEALEIAQWDASFVAAKLNRALRGRDEIEQDTDGDDDPVQNDWNGSAKIALISLERSDAAWQVIAQATGDAAPAALAGQMADLRREVEKAFPNARLFIRPGFDEPVR